MRPVNTAGWGVIGEDMDVVTGSFGYIGKYITKGLIASGRSVRTITTHPDKLNPFGDQVEAFSYDFDNPDLLTHRLKGCDCLFNTYWVRFKYKQCSFEKALKNTETLFTCAKRAGVKKVVHISVTNPSESDELPYYKGKAMQEELLKKSGLPWCIVRPTVVFGKEDILINNIAWTIRSFPVVPIFGAGDYKLQPVFVEDLASIAIECSINKESETIDAIGDETYTYKELIQLISSKVERKVFMMHVAPDIGIILGKMIGLFIRDVVLTKDELRGLMANKLTSDQRPNGRTSFSEWLSVNKDTVGREYTSEIKRHFCWEKRK